jgi:nitrate/nitrite transporter NarK
VADQAASGTMAGTGDTGTRGLDAQIGPSHVHEADHGRPASWVAVAIIFVGFLIGGIALPIGPTWWLFWTGAGIVVIGGIFALSVRILDDWY